MKKGNDARHLNIISDRTRKILLCVLSVILACSVALLLIGATIPDKVYIKARLMRQIKNNEWDPYSATMTLDEFYALMELFGEGKLPLNKQKRAREDDETDTSAETFIIPRERFILAGLPKEYAYDGSEEVLDQPLVYDYNSNYEPYDPATNSAYEIGENDGEYILNDKTYILNDDGRLYDESVAVKKYQYAFKSNINVIYVMNKDGEDENGAYQDEDFVVYDATEGTQVSLSSLNGTKLTSLSTGDVYIVEDGGIYEYNAETGESGIAFDEETGEFFVINKQIYVWKNIALTIPGSDNIMPCDAIKALSYRYPEGYGHDGAGYMRPPKDWAGVKVKNEGDVQTVLVKPGINDERYDISSDVDQSVFQGDKKDNGNYEHGILYDGYYINQITIDGANINILGIIRVPETGRLIYYYLSAEEQDWQVSTTTLRDDDKFLIEYVPNEYKIEYQVLMADDYTAGSDLTSNEIRAKSVANVVPQNVVMYGSNTATTARWVDSIFGTTATRAERTTGGAYSFDVLVPYGYEVQIFISVDRIISGTYKDSSGNDIPDIAKRPDAKGAIPYTFHVDIEHTGSRAKVEETWLNGYRDYLKKYGIINSDSEFKYTRTPDDGFSKYVTYEWYSDADPNAEVHNGVFKIIAERINDIQMHNSARSYDDQDNSQTGFPLGKEPEYSYYPGDGFKVFANADKGPASLTMNDTFYNHFVKANRLITAVLTKKAAPTFDVSWILKKSNGTSNRGTSAEEEYAKTSIKHYNAANGGKDLADFNGDFYDAAYYYYAGNSLGIGSAPLGSSDKFPNVVTADGWQWKDDKAFSLGPKGMWTNSDGTYTYSWIFQTNSSDSYILDALEVNGIPVYVPYFPKYKWPGGYPNTADAASGESAQEANRPYFTETTLQDGSTLTVEMLSTFTGKPQRVYRITVTGARTNVTVTGLNLMSAGSGAPEFSVYGLTGVYDGVGSQTDSTIQYYDITKGWTTGYQANVVVSNDSNPKSGIRTGGDGNMRGANLRFKTADGYGSPYYIWVDTKDEVIGGQTSLPYKKDENGNDTTELDIGHPNEVINWSEVKANPSKWTGSDGYLLSQYIYYQDDSNSKDYGYYYIHVTEPGKYADSRICLLTIVAKTVKYTVRYTSSYDPKNPEAFNSTATTAFYGYIQDKTGALSAMQYGTVAPNGKQFLLNAKSMPETIHDRETCELVAMIDPDVRDKWWDILHQYDDNGGAFYDMLYNTKAAIASNEYGTVRPKDSSSGYNFVAWVLVDEYFKPYESEEGYIYFYSGIIDLNIYGDYAVKHSAFGTDAVDLNVLRLMPVWVPNSNPYAYSVVLNWIDAKGTLNQKEFSDWEDVTTEAQDGDQLFVFLNKNSKPLQNWIASHPTYTFWDSVNNAITKFTVDEDGNVVRDRLANTEILKQALEEYLDRDYNPERYPEDVMLLQALVNRDYTGYNESGEQTKAGRWVATEKENLIEDPYYYNMKDKDPTYKQYVSLKYEYKEGGNGMDDFDRLDSNIFRVNENGGTISIWMYEDKGGLVFRKEVMVEPFTGDDEFYFSVINNWVGKEKPKENLTEDKIPRLGMQEPVSYKAYPQTFYNEKEGTWGFYDDEGNFTAATDANAWTITFYKGEIISIEHGGEQLVELNADGEPILDEYGNTIPITYFTLAGAQGVSLYVPNGNYTIVEVGSKSGGSYQAEVTYTDTSGNQISGSVELPTGKDENGNDVELWMKGSNKQYIRLGKGEKYDEGQYEGVSQIPVTVIFQTGEKELIQTITFFNKTNSLSVKMTLHDNVREKTYPTNGTQTDKDNWEAKYNSDYDFAVVFSLPAGQSPLVQGAAGYARTRAATDGYYFKMNIYTDLDSDKKKFVRTVDVPFVKYNPQYDEDNNPNPDRNPWEIETDNYENLWIGKFTLQPGEQGALVMQVMTGSVNYWVDEPGKTDENNSKLWNDLTPTWKTSKYGTANVGMENSAWVENYYGKPTPEQFGYLKIEVKGGNSNESFLFRITGLADDGLNSVDIIVSVKGGESTYIYILYGTYKVEEIGWAWRYNVTSAITTTVGMPHTEYKYAQTITFNATSNGAGWLGGESSTNKKLS